jgi:hypothetical protein
MTEPLASKPRPKLFHLTYRYDILNLLFLPYFLGAPKKRGVLLPRRVAAFWEGPVMYGRNREIRSREAAGRRNWPEAVPRKMNGKKRMLTEVNRNRELLSAGSCLIS